MADEQGSKSLLKEALNEGLKKLAAESKAAGQEHVDAWKDSQEAKKVAELIKEIAELQLRATLVAEDADPEEKKFLLGRVEKKTLQLAHAVETEKLLVALTLKSTFLEVLGIGLGVVKEVGKEALTIAVAGALQGVASKV